MVAQERNDDAWEEGEDDESPQGFDGLYVTHRFAARCIELHRGMRRRRVSTPGGI